MPTDWRGRVDLLIRLMLVMGFACWAAVCLRGAFDMARQIDFARPQQGEIGSLLQKLSIGLFTLMYAVVYAIRLKPVSRFPGLVPCAVAIVGGFMMLSLSQFTPRGDLPLAMQGLSAALVVTGNLLSTAIILKLGKSFSIVPEGRRLVTTGIYGIVRHPLYLAEAVATLGAVVNYASPWVWALFAAHLGLQLARIYYEEDVLRRAFPEYAAYARRTARLIPGLY